MTRDERAKLHAPPVPPETCPRVDELSTLLDAISGDLDTFREGLDFGRRKTVDKAEVIELLLDQSANLAGARVRLEELRAANAQLRESGRYWREQHRVTAELLEARVRELEVELGINPERNAEIARAGGKPLNALKVAATTERRDFQR
jgi:hypothetical protein